MLGRLLCPLISERACLFVFSRKSPTHFVCIDNQIHVTGCIPPILSWYIDHSVSRANAAMCINVHVVGWDPNPQFKFKGERQSARVTALQKLLRNNQVGYKVLQ